MFVEELMDLKCRTAESPDGTIKTLFAQVRRGNDQVIIASIELPTRMLEELSLSSHIQSLRWVKYAEEPMAPRCRTAEFQDGTTRTQSAQERQVRDLVTIALTELITRMLVLWFSFNKNTTFPPAPTEMPWTASQPALNL